jgi:four helix bundle protein
MPTPARSFEDLIVWKKAHAFVLNVYRISKQFPREEIYGLTMQLRRSAVSVPANIAEGFKKRGKADKARVLNIAEGSLEEARYYLRLAEDLGYVNTGAPSRRRYGSRTTARIVHASHSFFFLLTPSS